jgi:hypothetical protein
MNGSPNAEIEMTKKNGRKPASKPVAEEKPVQVLYDVLCMHGTTGQWHHLARYDIAQMGADGQPVNPPPPALAQQFAATLQNGGRVFSLPGEVLLSMDHYSAIKFQRVA